METTNQLVRVDDRVIQLSNLDKLLWPEDNVTKGDLISYYYLIADRLLPHLAGRPLTLTRYPDGINGAMFYQKDTPSYAPEWLRTYSVHSRDRAGTIRYLLADEPAALVWLANQGVIEIHPWLSTIDHPERPDRVVIDLDPSDGATFADVVEVARLMASLLSRLGLIGFPKLSGATGMHVYIPVEPRYTSHQASSFVCFLGRLIVQAYPEKATMERRVSKREGKVYIDHLQNLPGKTIVAPYSPRPLPGAPVSVPIAWNELGAVRADEFTLVNAEVIRARPDHFAVMASQSQQLDHVLPLCSVNRV